MIKWAVAFVVIAVILAVLGFGGLIGVGIGIGLAIVKILFWIAVVIAVALFILGFTVYRKVT